MLRVTSLAALRNLVSSRWSHFWSHDSTRLPPPWTMVPHSPQATSTFKLRSACLFEGGLQPWRTQSSPRPTIPSMICQDEIAFLYYLARTQFRNEGCIVEFGPLGGTSTSALAAGASNAVLHAYDFWIFYETMQSLFPNERLRPGQSLLPAFRKNIRPYKDRVRTHSGDLSHHRWTGGPIEIAFVDAAKTPAALLHMFREFFPWVVPGGWIVWQDYFSSTCPWIHLALEELSDCFEYWDSPEGGTVVTRLKRPLQRESLPANYFGTLPIEQATLFFARAQDRFPGWEALDVRLAEALWLALAGRDDPSRKIVEETRLDPRFSQGNFDYDLNFIALWSEATRAGKPFTAV